MPQLKKYFIVFFRRRVKPLDPLNESLKKAAKITLCVSITAIVAILILKLSQTLCMWPILASLFVPQMYQGNTRKYRFITQIIATIVATTAIIVASLLSHSFYAYVIFMLVSTFITFYLLKYGMTIFYPALIITLLILFAGGMQINTPIIALYRGLGFFSAGVFAIIITHIIFPYRPEKNLNSLIISLFSEMGGFLQSVVNNALCGNFNRSRLFDIKYRILQNLEKTRILVDNSNNESMRELFSLQGKIFIHIVALSDLFNKPSSEYTLDHLEIINDELFVLSKTIMNLPAGNINLNYQTIKNHITQIQDIAKTHNNILMQNDMKCLDFLLHQLFGVINACKI